ncbi:GAF domain-containing protein [Scytonema sp. UIC 10036]|uniref:HD domain-containing phosphohydrolase n=1 Tax=Scytonema sp. UIC 10036 TaxID=2304196 RepID=UPI0012DA3017|nr:HD domain-containing phosphohydrolase [Scytonema sp. UIC 10036]MUH00253.1 GAF domain-containing protein [Scytonema sp. UIC 10036]
MYRLKLDPKERISYTYFLISTAWIIATDLLFVKGDFRQVLYQSCKGLLFAAITSYLLYLLIEKNYGAKQKIQRERNEAVETYTQLFEQHGLPQLLIDPLHGKIIQANDAAVTFYGWSKEKICSMSISEINLLSEDEIFDEIAAARSQHGNHFKFVHRRANGNTRDVEVYSHPVQLHGQKLLYSIIVDVSEKKQAQFALLRSNQLLKLLVASIRAMMRHYNKQEIADAVTQALVEQGKYAMAWIGEVPDNPSMPIALLSKWGDTTGYLENIKITWDSTETAEGSTGRAIKLGKPQTSTDIQHDAGYRHWRQSALYSGFRSSAAFPLFHSSRVVAVLNLYSREPNAFDDEEIYYLEALAGDLSRALYTTESLMEYERIDAERLAAISRSKEALLEAVAALSETLEVRDPYTAGHQRRVAWLAVAIGKQLGLTKQRLEALNIAALLHDIGKIAIPSEILSKPTRLSRIEFELIKQHPQVGEEILKKVSFEWPIATIVGQHHERLDGTGYPRGIMGEEIMEESRILSVADVMEAMISHRPYRPGLSLEHACLELENNINKKYDANVVNACIKIMRDGGYQFLGMSGEPTDSIWLKCIP